MKNKTLNLVTGIIILSIILLEVYKISQPAYFAIKSDTVEDQVYAYKLITKSNKCNDLYLSIAKLIEKDTKISSEDVNKIVDASGYKNVEKTSFKGIDTKITYTINTGNLTLIFYYNESKKLIERIDEFNKDDNIQIQVFRDDADNLYIQSFKKCNNLIERYIILKKLRNNDVKIVDDKLRPILKEMSNFY